MNELVPQSSGTPKRLVRLWSQDYMLVATKSSDQADEAFIAEHVKPGEWLPMTVDFPDGRRWSCRAECSVGFHRDDHYLRKMVTWPRSM